jgi:hypothetical protein
MEQWDVKKDGRILINRIHKIKKKENETVREFNIKFQKLLDKIPQDIKPKNKAIPLYYTNAFEGPFGFYLRDKSPSTLKAAQDTASRLEENFTASQSGSVWFF